MARPARGGMKRGEKKALKLAQNGKEALWQDRESRARRGTQHPARKNQDLVIFI